MFLFTLVEGYWFLLLGPTLRTDFLSFSICFVSDDDFFCFYLFVWWLIEVVYDVKYCKYCYEYNVKYYSFYGYYFRYKRIYFWWFQFDILILCNLTNPLTSEIFTRNSWAVLREHYMLSVNWWISNLWDSVNELIWCYSFNCDCQQIFRFRNK